MSCVSGTKDPHATEHIPLTEAVGKGVQLILSGAEPESTVTLQFHLNVLFIGEILPTSVRTSMASRLDSIRKVMGRKGDLGQKTITSRAPSKKSSNATLTKLANLEEKLKKRLAEVKTGTAKYTTAQTNTKDKLMIASEGVTDCRPIVHVMITKEEPELVVIYPEDNLREQKNIDGTNPPTMPTMSIKARLKNYDKDVSFYITFTKLQWTAPGTNPQKITKGYFEGNKTDNGEVEIPFTLPVGYVRGGDDMTIDVRAVAGGKTYQTNLENPFKIQRLNPLRATLYAVLGEDIYAAVAWKESSFRQFKGSPGFPLQGVDDPNDIGVMGLRGDLLNDDRIWNWVSNAQAGKDYFINTCMARANNYHTFAYFSNCDPKPTPLNNDIHSPNKNQNQVFLQAYCYYNAGPYSHAMCWNWVKGDSWHNQAGHWEENTSSNSRVIPHANQLWDIFISNPKPWNQ